MASSTARVLAALLLTAVFALALACGSSGDGATAPGSTSTPGSTTTSSEVAGSAGATATGPPWTAPTQGGRFLVTIRPEHGAPRIGALDPWLVKVTSPTGAPVQPFQLRFDGGMPQHGHGFESKPRVTDDLGAGLIRVDGVRFQMSGAWTIRVDVATAEGADFALFELEIGP